MQPVSYKILRIVDNIGAMHPANPLSMFMFNASSPVDIVIFKQLSFYHDCRINSDIKFATVYSR